MCPKGQPVVIHMISQDVIHALYIPALRIQMDTIPGRYTDIWFKADKVGVLPFVLLGILRDRPFRNGWNALPSCGRSDYQKWLTQADFGCERR